jgi:hypothetical protein
MMIIFLKKKRTAVMLLKAVRNAENLSNMQQLGGSDETIKVGQEFAVDSIIFILFNIGFPFDYRKKYFKRCPFTKLTAD